MKRIGTLIICMLLVAQSVVAAEEKKENGWYVGLGAGQSTIDTGISHTTGTASYDDNDMAFKVFAGYKIIKRFGFELYYLNAGEASFKGNAGDSVTIDGIIYPLPVNVNIDGKAISYGVAAVYFFPIHRYFSPFAKMGAQLWKVNGNVSSSAGGLSFSDEGAGVMLGAGAGIEVTDHISFRGEFERVDMGDPVDVVSGSLIYKF